MPSGHDDVRDPRFDPSRRRLLAGLGAAGASAALSLWPRLNLAATGADTRLLVVLLRGAMDGLHLLPPQGDADYARLRGELAVQSALRLDGDFGLHPALPFAHQLYARKQLLPVLAVAPPYRQRSHFDAQDCLENGSDRPGGARDGWLARAVTALGGAASGVAVAQVMPLAMRGSDRVATWSPPLPRPLDEALLARLQTLYAADPQLAAAFDDALQVEEPDAAGVMAGSGMQSGEMQSGGAQSARASSPNAQSGAGSRRLGGFRLPDALAAAARRMRGADGARVGFVEDTGWDTHRGQMQALQRKFGELDAGLRAVEQGLGLDWARTVVVVTTEFGRTAAANGSGGTDHGVGGHALLAGGAVRGGRIAGDWPGLGARALHDGRDLRATTDLRAVFKGLLLSHLGVPEAALETRVFPGGGAVRAMTGLT